MISHHCVVVETELVNTNTERHTNNMCIEPLGNELESGRIDDLTEYVKLRYIYIKVSMN